MPNGMPSGPHRGRHREPAQIEQIDEVGIGAEPAVELDRIGQHLLDGIDRRRGRQQQRIDRLEHRIPDAAQLFKLVERSERIDGARPRAFTMMSLVTGWIDSGDDASSDLSTM